MSKAVIIGSVNISINVVNASDEALNHADELAQEKRKADFFATPEPEWFKKYQEKVNSDFDKFSQGANLNHEAKVNFMRDEFEKAKAKQQLRHEAELEAMRLRHQAFLAQMK